MLQKQGVLSLGTDTPQRKPLSGRRAVWYALALVAVGSLYHLGSSNHNPTASTSVSTSSFVSNWPSSEVAEGPSGRVHSFGGPARSSFSVELLDSLTNQTTRRIPSHSASLARQQKLCPHSSEQADVLQLEDFGPWWESVSEADLAAGRDSLAIAVARGFGFELDGDSAQSNAVSEAEWELQFGDGRRGVVYTGGNGDTLFRLVNSITVLRKLGCVLPIEIWSFPDELAAMPLPIRDQLASLGEVTFRVSAAPKTKDDKQFQIKGEAIAHSRFTEILYLDSDNVPVRDPTFLFDSPVYKENGIVLWPDFARDSPANPVFRLFGVDCNPEEWTAETGQIVVNREGQRGMNQAALLAAEAMQRESAFWFKLSQGDKDTFRYAFKFLGIPYTAAPHLLSAAGSSTVDYRGGDGSEHDFCGHTMVQHGLSSAEWDGLEVDADYEIPTDHAPPLFMHANMLKETRWLWVRDALGPKGWALIKTLTGKGWNYRKGNTFNQIKIATPDLVSSPTGSTFLTEQVRYGVYKCRGAGTDLFTAGANQIEEGGEGVQLVEFKEAWGGVLRNFEDLFYSLKSTN